MHGYCKPVGFVLIRVIRGQKKSPRITRTVIVRVLVPLRNLIRADPPNPRESEDGIANDYIQVFLGPSYVVPATSGATEVTHGPEPEPGE